MKIITPQYKNGVLMLNEIDTHEMNKEYKNNQPVKCKVTRISPKMEPSILENNTLFSCFSLLVENSENPRYTDVEKVKECCKVGIDFRDPKFVLVRPDGGIQFKYRSFSFKELPESNERRQVMQNAFVWTAGELGISVDDMVAEAKSRMRSYK